MNSICRVKPLQKYVINEAAFPKVLFSSLLLTILSYELIAKLLYIQNKEIIYSRALKQVAKITLCAICIIISAYFFRLFMRKHKTTIICVRQLPFVYEEAPLIQKMCASLLPPAPLPTFSLPKLINHNNSCFINVILQMIFSNPNIAKPFLSHADIEKGYNMYLKAAQNGLETDLASFFRNLNKFFEGSGQHDACEFLETVFIDKIDQVKDSSRFPFFKIKRDTHDSFLENNHSKDENLKQRSIPCEEATCEEAKTADIPKNPSLTGLETAIILKLVFPQTNDGLRKDPYTIEELIKNTLPIQSITHIAPPSDYLFVFLQRSNNPSEGIDKINDPIAFKATFSIPSECSLEGKEAHYRWVSFLVHTGSANSGHYVCFTWAPNSKYYYCDDLQPSIQEIGESDFIKQGKLLYGGIAERIHPQTATHSAQTDTHLDRLLLDHLPIHTPYEVLASNQETPAAYEHSDPGDISTPPSETVKNPPLSGLFESSIGIDDDLLDFCPLHQKSIVNLSPSNKLQQIHDDILTNE